MTMIPIDTVIEFTSPCLANSPRAGTDGGIDVFERDEAGNPMWHPRCLDAAIRRAAQFVNGVSDAGQILTIDPTFSAPVTLFHREYTRNRQTHERTHEAVLTSVPCEITVRISENQLAKAKDMLASLGKLVGISPFGHNLGFGRFEIIDFQPKTKR